MLYSLLVSHHMQIGLPCGALWTGRPNVSTPYWSHAVIDYAMVRCLLYNSIGIFSDGALVKNLIGWKMLFVRYTHNLHRSIRKRYLKKLEREAKKQ